MKRRVALLALPLLLIGALGALKWRADHPPLSPLDRALRDVVDHASWVRLKGTNKGWRQLTGLRDSQALIIQDQGLLREMEDALRCTEKPLTRDPFGSTMVIHIGVAFADGQTPTNRWTGFTYSGNPQGYHTLVQDGEEVQGARIVPPRFARKFEAFVARMAHSAQDPDSPGVIIGSHPIP